MERYSIASAGLSRRSFVGAAAATSALVLTSSSIEARAEEVPAAEDAWDYEADVVVVGAGGAGLPAALKALQEGASVIVVEANWDCGGHTSVSEGNLHSGAGTEIQERYGIEDSPDRYYTDHTLGSLVVSRYNDRDCVRAIANAMVEAYDFIQEKGVIVQDAAPTFSGKSAFDPEVVGGSNPDTVQRQTIPDAASEGWESYRGKHEGGIGITRPLERSARQEGARFLLNYHMDKIVREDDGPVQGIVASYTPHVLPGQSEPLGHLMSDGDIKENAPTVRVKANRGVIVCTGGSTGNLTFRTAFDPRLGPEFDGLAGMPFSDQDASGELAAMAVGASLGMMTNYNAHGGGQVCPASRYGCRYGYGNGWTTESKLWPLVAATGVNADLESMVIVNMLGQRFANTDILGLGKYNDQTHDFYDAMLSSVLVTDENGETVRYGGPIWAIFDQATCDAHEWDMVQGTVDYDNGYCFKADTLEELAEKVVNKYYEQVKMDPAVLAETIANYNSYVDAGEDPEFGTVKNLVNKVETAPFYAAWAMPNMHDTYAGLRVNNAMQVVDIYGEPIPGLYAAGECASGLRIHGHGRVITAGYLAGQNAARSVMGPAAPGAASRGDAITTELAVYGEAPREETAEAGKKAALSDGTYAGMSANAQGGELKLEIAVEGGAIADIKVTAQNETPTIGGEALSALVEQALEAQGPAIDGVAGATVTTEAFKEALASAIAKA